VFTGSRDGTTSIPRAVGPVTRGRTARVLTRRIDGDDSRRVPDYLIVEEPMSIRLDGELVATTMRTPGDDFELAVGFCVTEGVLAGVGSVVVFLPQIVILFFFILAMEATGYMARAAFLMDRLMAGVGLSGDGGGYCDCR